MVSYYIRKSREAGQLMVSLRIREKGYDKHFALGIQVNDYRWQYISQTLKAAAAAYKRNAPVFIEDELARNMWDVQRELTARMKARKLTEEYVHQKLRDVFQKDEQVSAASDFEEEKRKPTFIEFIDQYIQECESGERLKQKSTRKVTPGTIRNNKGFQSQILAYQKERKRVVDWDDLTMEFYNDYKQFFIEKSYSPNTIARHIKNMKTILYAAKALHLTTRDDFMSKMWSADKEEVDNIYIPEQRLKEMHNFDMSDYQAMKKRVELFAKDDLEKKSLIHALKRDIYRQKLSEARDIFLMGCLVGQRVSDYKRINTDMIETIQGDRKFLHLIQVKTEKDVYVPYNNIIGEILAKYDGKLPKVYDQHLNERIKVVGLLLGWTESAGLTERKGLMEFPSRKRFCDAIATHTARRTFATNAYKNGVPLSAIMAVTGHSSEEMLRRYLKLNTKERAMLAAAEFDKVKMAL